MISAQDVSLLYKEATSSIVAIDHVSVEIKENEFVGILGPSGSGKSSLLYILSGLKRPTTGAVNFKDLSYPKLAKDELATLRRESFGFIFQYNFLLNYLTGLENVLVAADKPNRACELFDLFGVSHCLNKFPYEMSAGERQRVSVIRAVMNNPQVIFADEPTASLDRDNAQKIMQCLREFLLRGSLIVATHDETILEGARVLRIYAGKLQ